MSQIYQDMTRDVEAGKFKTMLLAQTDLKRRIDERAQPEFRLVNQGNATTLPTPLANTVPATTQPSPG